MYFKSKVTQLFQCFWHSYEFEAVQQSLWLHSIDFGRFYNLDYLSEGCFSFRRILYTLLDTCDAVQCLIAHVMVVDSMDAYCNSMYIGYKVLKKMHGNTHK